MDEDRTKEQIIDELAEFRQRVTELEAVDTERVRAGAALRDAEQRLLDTINFLPDATFAIDPEGNVIAWNRAIEEMTGIKGEEIEGKGNYEYAIPFYGIRRPVLADLALKPDKEIEEKYPSIRRENDVLLVESIHLRVRGQDVVLWAKASPIFNSRGEVIGAIESIRDITEHKRSEEALRRSERELRIRNQIAYIFLTTPDEEVFGEVLQVIQEAIKSPYGLFGYIDEDGAWVCPSMSRDIWGQGQMPGKDIVFPRETWGGIWGCALIEKKTLYANTPFRVPEGHVPILRALDVPIIYQREVIGNLLVGNKATDYDKEDCKLLEAIADHIAPILNARLERDRQDKARKRAEKKLQKSYEKLQRALEGTVNTLVSTIELRDPYTAGHQRQVTKLACAIAREMGLPEEQVEGIRMAGLIHDMGKITVPAEILSKPGGLNDLQFGLIKMHPQIGYDILKGTDFPWPLAQIVLQHHERMNGSGYPQGLSGEEIMLEARILAVADVVVAMASHRPYRPALGLDKALEEIAQNKGVLYDPEVVDACLRLFTEKGFSLE